LEYFRLGSSSESSAWGCNAADQTKGTNKEVEDGEEELFLQELKKNEKIR